MAGPRTDSRTLPGLNDHLRRIGLARDRDERAAAFAALAADADRARAAGYLLGKLLSRGSNGQRFALEVAALLAPPLPEELLPHLTDLLEVPGYPTRLRITVAARVINSVPASAPEVGRVIEALRKKVSPGRALNRLRRLAAIVPPLGSLTRALADLDAGTVAPCPRCGARLSAEALGSHLWERHRLLLEKGHVREPWDVIGQWVTAFGRTNKPEYLDRSCDLAQALDPTGGLSRVHRLLLLGGADDEEAHALLRAEAAGQNATLCPHCYALIPLPTQARPTAVLVGAGRVDGGGFRVELTDRYMFTNLVAETPDGSVFSGPEPGRTLTHRGAVLLFLVPLVGAAFVFAFLPPLLKLAPIIPVAGLLLTAIIAYLAVALTWPDADDSPDRAVDHAWTVLVPRLLRRPVRRSTAAFLAGLAAATRGHGSPEDREDQVRDAISELSKDQVGLPYLTPLVTLQIEDAVRAGADDLPRIADHVGECFDGTYSLDHAERLVKDLRGDPADRTRRARLRVLILARAFGAGLEAEDLRMLGQASPTLGTAYASEDRDGLARLRLLWLYRPERLWQRVGSATTVFDLARYPSLAENYLRQRPDLLLFQASGGTDGAAPILVCEEGVVYRESVITDPDVFLKVRARTLVRGGGFELTIGETVYKFREDPTLLARRIKGWAQFLFDEFLPRARLLTRRRSEHGDRLIVDKMVKCTECRRIFLGLTGEIGLATVAPAQDGVG